MVYFCYMLTKYYIEIDGSKAEIPKECLNNWDEIKCSYKRSDFDGVIRSFSSQFEFVGKMYDKLIELYLRDGINAHAVLSLYTITNEWQWEKRFSCELDFSSISWENGIVKINCIDDSLAAIIKAQKSTKYEFVVGDEVPVAGSLSYDRITMQNTCTHEIMGDSTENEEDAAVAIAPSSQNAPMQIYLVGDAETYENSPILSQDQSAEDNSYFVEVVKAADKVEMEFEIRLDHIAQGYSVLNSHIYLFTGTKAADTGEVTWGSSAMELFDFSTTGISKRTYLGLFPTFEALKLKHPKAPADSWALVGDSYETASEAYVATSGNVTPREWVKGDPKTSYPTPGSSSGVTRSCETVVFRNKFSFSNVAAGTCYGMFYRLQMWAGSLDAHPEADPRMFLTSKIETHWKSKGDTIAIDAVTPVAALSSLMEKICERKNLDVNCHIDTADARIAKTYLFAAESIRNIPGAKLYTSFNEFCDWMSAVFGYTYYLGQRKKSQFARARKYSMQASIPETAHLNHTMCPGGFSDQIVLVDGSPYFAVMGDDLNEDKSLNFYTKWDGSEQYNDPETGKARLDTIFFDDQYYRGIYFDDAYTLKTYPGDYKSGVSDKQDIYFVPRSEIFAGNKTIRLSNVREFKYSVNGSLGYSTVTVGYDKQEYGAQCGRDEWNFDTKYTTPVENLDKKLSLMSKYRADCYGFEFLAQKRAEDTTDSKGDNTLFFVGCKQSNGRLIVDRSAATITGALSDDVFNGQYAPYRCALANGSFIAAAMCPMGLRFASSDGNTDVTIDGVKGNDNLTLSDRLFSIGEAEFSSPDVDVDLDVNALYEVEVDEIIYRGFLKEVSFNYARPESVKYKLILREVEI